MKTWLLLIGIIVILAILCSPGLAIISKSELISYHLGDRGGEHPTPQIPSWYITPTPTPDIPIIEPPPDWVGSISVMSDPAGANVYLDGTFKGTTPITISGVAAAYYPCDGVCIGYPATYEIKLTKTGYKEYITGVNVIKGETTSVTAALTPIFATQTPTNVPTIAPTKAPLGTGSISVSSDPTGAPVYLDDVYKGVTPVTITGVSYGLHRLKVIAIKYGVPANPYSTLVKVLNSTPVDVHVGQWSWSWWNGDQIS